MIDFLLIILEFSGLISLFISVLLIVERLWKSHFRHSTDYPEIPVYSDTRNPNAKDYLIAFDCHLILINKSNSYRNILYVKVIDTNNKEYICQLDPFFLGMKQHQYFEIGTGKTKTNEIPIYTSDFPIQITPYEAINCRFGLTIPHETKIKKVILKISTGKEIHCPVLVSLINHENNHTNKRHKAACENEIFETKENARY